MRLTLMMVMAMAATAVGAQQPGPVGHWSFDEAEGGTVHDLSGRGADATLHGGELIERGEGRALALDGVHDWVDCGAGASLDLTEAVTLEAWVRPDTIPAGEPLIVGKSTESYGLTFYKDGQCWWYISSGGNNLKAPLAIDAWNHVVGTFDGETMTIYVNGELVASRASQFDTIAHGGRFSIGARLDDDGQPAAQRFRGAIDDVRVYDRALTAEEVLHSYKLAAGGYGVDTTWFNRLRVTPAFFRDEQRLLVLYDFRGIAPRPEGARLEVKLLRADGDAPEREIAVDPLPREGLVAAEFDLAELPDGDYVLSAALTAPDGPRVTDELGISYPFPALQVPSPEELAVPELPSRPAPAPYEVRVHPGGGFTVEAAGRVLAFESAYSYPGGGENRLAADEPDVTGEDGWQVRARRAGADAWEVTARGAYYEIVRQITRRATRVEVHDTIRNLTDQVLGVMVDNRLDASAQPFADWAVAGYPNAVERRAAHSPTVFARWEDLGVGLVPLDDVYIVQGTMYCRDGVAGMADDIFGLAPGASYTLQWAIYAHEGGDYWDFINQVRRDEGRTGTIEGGFAFIPRDGVSDEYVEMRNLRYGSFGCLTHVADDPEIEIEGIEFINLPLERARLRREFAAIREQHPHLKLMFHVAHSLFSTNRPAELFPDSRVLDAAGNHVVYPYNYGNGAYFSQRRHEEGWRWFIYYPTPGNSFHDAMMLAADMIMDDIGCNGAFMDGFMLGYGSAWIYDRWDGHSVEIDPETKTVTRRLGSVLLLSQPSMVEFTHRITDRGGVVVANSPVMTRTIGQLPLVVDQECISGPDVHLAQTSASLGNPSRINCEADVYRDVLDKLSWGNLYFYYGEGELTHPSLPQQMYPITITDLRSGTVTGRERIVTMHSGVYGWPGDRRLHSCRRYNALGMPVPAEFVTRVDAGGVRTQVDLDREESAVVVAIPVEVQTDAPVNVLCARYDGGGIVIHATGEGRVSLRVSDGEFAVAEGAHYQVTAGETFTAIAEADGVRIDLRLDGPTRIAIEPAAE